MSTNQALQEVNSLIDKFYEKFLLRDVFAKIVPGIVLLVSFIFSLSQDLSETKDLLDISWLIVIGFAWIIGFGIQGFGELLGAIRYYTKTYKTDKEWFVVYNAFFFNASSEEKSNGERLVVIKEATGNLAISLLLSIIILNISFFVNGSHLHLHPLTIFGSIVTFTFVLILYYMHRIHVSRQCKYIEVVNAQASNSKSN